jgi:peptide/nickel transport system permease protein
MPELPSSSTGSPYATSAPGELRRSDEILPAGGYARDITAIADDQVREHEPLHQLDPDQVEAGTYRRKLGWQFWLPLAWFLLVLFFAVFAKWLPLKPPDQINRVGSRTAKNLPPFSTFGGQVYPLGTDTLGRDMLSRLAYGAQVSLQVGFGAIALGLLIGVPIGLAAGYFKNMFKGAIDAVLSSIMYVLLAFPALLLLILIITFTDSREVKTLIVALAIVSIPPIAVLVRASTMSFTQREFVLAARTIGASHLRVMMKEVFPNVILPIFSFAVIGVAVVIAAEGALAFLGLSVQPPTPTWGGMINEGRTAFDIGEYWPSLTPCIIMFLTILSLNLCGDRLREYFDVKEGAL